jgi:hypothetical protein
LFSDFFFENSTRPPEALPSRSAPQQILDQQACKADNAGRPFHFLVYSAKESLADILMHKIEF